MSLLLPPGQQVMEHRLGLLVELANPPGVWVREHGQENWRKLATTELLALAGEPLAPPSEPAMANLRRDKTRRNQVVEYVPGEIPRVCMNTGGTTIGVRTVPKGLEYEAFTHELVPYRPG